MWWGWESDSGNGDNSGGVGTVLVGLGWGRDRRCRDGVKMFYLCHSIMHIMAMFMVSVRVTVSIRVWAVYGIIQLQKYLTCI